LKEKIGVKKVNLEKEYKSKKNLAKQFGRNSVKDYQYFAYTILFTGLIR